MRRRWSRSRVRSAARSARAKRSCAPSTRPSRGPPSSSRTSRTRASRRGPTTDANVEVRRSGTPREFGFRRAPPLGARRAPGDPRLRARRQARQGALHGAVGARRAARARPRPVHAGPPHEAARLPGGLGPASRERGDDARDGPAPEVRGGALQDRRAGGGPVALPHSHRRGAADRAAQGRDPRGRDAAAKVHRVHAVLPPRGRVVREGHAGLPPPAPVRQGRAREGGGARVLL